MNGVNFCSPISIYDGMYPRAAKAFEVQNVNWLRPRGASDRNLSLFGVFKPQYLDLIAALPDKSILDGVFTRSCDVANAWLAMRKWEMRLQDSGQDSVYVANDLDLTGRWDEGIVAQSGISIRKIPGKRFQRFDGKGLEYFQYWNAPLVVIPFGKHYELLIGKLSAQSFSDFALIQFWKLVMQDMKPAKTKFTGAVVPMWAIPETPMEVSFLQGLKAQTGDIVGQALAAAKSTMVAAGLSFKAGFAARFERSLEESRWPLKPDMVIDGDATFAVRLRDVPEFARVPLAVGQISHRRFANVKDAEPKIQFGE